MRDSVKSLFFGQSRGTRVIFKGARVSMDRDENCRRLLDDLQDLHDKAGAPEYLADYFQS